MPTLTNLSESLLDVEIALCMVRGALAPYPNQPPVVYDRTAHVQSLLTSIHAMLDTRVAHMGAAALRVWNERLQTSRAHLENVRREVVGPLVEAEEFGSRADHAPGDPWSTLTDPKQADS